MKTILSYVAFCSIIATAHGQIVLFQDDFNAGSINTSVWNESLPFGTSTLTESGGNLTTSGRGTLYTKQGFNTPYVISGQMTLNNSLEHFNILFRSDFSIFPPLAGTAERNGVLVSFSNDGDQISIQRFDPAFPSQDSILAVESYSLSTGTPYTFSITDTGDQVSLSVNGVPEIAGNTTYASGNQIGFYSREFSGSSTSVNFIQVATVPEPKICGLVFGLMSIVGIALKRKIYFENC